MEFFSAILDYSDFTVCNVAGYFPGHHLYCLTKEFLVISLLLVLLTILLSFVCKMLKYHCEVNIIAENKIIHPNSFAPETYQLVDTYGQGVKSFNI